MMAVRAVPRIPLSICNHTGRIDPNQESGKVKVSNTDGLV